MVCTRVYTLMRVLHLSLAVMLLLGASSAVASAREVDLNDDDDLYNPGVYLEATSGSPGSEASPTGEVEATASTSSYEYTWLLACFQNHPDRPIMQCQGSQTCAEPRALQWSLWARQTKDEQGQPTPEAPWQPVLTECRLTDPPAIVTPRPQVTDALVLTEVRRLGLPRLTVEVQPDEATLVNFETIFYAESLPWQRTVDLLGYTVDVRQSRRHTSGSSATDSRCPPKTQELPTRKSSSPTTTPTPA